MTRRELFKLILVSPLAKLDVGVPWIHSPSITERLALNELLLSGIPYHQSNASMGTWLGFSREIHTSVQPNLDLRLPEKAK